MKWYKIAIISLSVSHNIHNESAIDVFQPQNAIVLIYSVSCSFDKPIFYANCGDLKQNHKWIFMLNITLNLDVNRWSICICSSNDYQTILWWNNPGLSMNHRIKISTTLAIRIHSFAQNAQLSTGPLNISNSSAVRSIYLFLPQWRDEE